MVLVLNIIVVMMITMIIVVQWGLPQNGWFIRENPIYKWMMNRGSPISGNLHIQVS